MCPPSSEDSLLARSTVATAFHRIAERIRCSTARSPGCGGSWETGIVFTYGVFAEYGTGAPAAPRLADEFVEQVVGALRTLHGQDRLEGLTPLVGAGRVRVVPVAVVGEHASAVLF